MRIIETENFKKLEKKATAPLIFNCPESGYTATIMDYSNKGPLIIVKLQNGKETRCMFDILTGKWKPLGM
jgi:hypothetical protein